MAEVTYDSATCIYPGADRPAVDALQLPIKDGEFVVLVGPSGCGKTTALRMLAGLEEIDDGSIRIDGKDMVGVPSRDRDIAMVFQNYALYPADHGVDYCRGVPRGTLPPIRGWRCHLSCARPQARTSSMAAP
jgi:ABC-type sugar transport system ATPase subunit